MKTLKIFEGKQREYNVRVLTLLYDHGPLSAWGLTAKIPSARGARQSLHATLNKRLRELEKKGYLHRENKMWYLRFKGIIATLLVLDNVRIWNSVWKDIFEIKAKIIEQNSIPLVGKFGLTNDDLHTARERIGLSLEDFNKWVELSKAARSLMENGIIDFDVIKEETLFGLIIMESMTAEQLADIWNPEPTQPDKNQ